MPEEEQVLEITEETKLDDVVAIPPDDINDDHRAFLTENKGRLTDDQKERFKISDEDEEGDEEEGEEGDDEDKPKGEEGEEGEEGDGEEGEEDEDDDDAEVDPDKTKIGVKKKTSKKTQTDEDDIDESDEATINKQVDKRTKPLVDKQQALEDQQAVDALIAETPELKKYRGQALKYMKHPSYKNVPAQRILNMLSAPDQQKIGAKKERAAAKKANESKGGGGSSLRKTNMGAKDYTKLSPEQMEKEIAEAKGQA